MITKVIEQSGALLKRFPRAVTRVHQDITNSVALQV